MKGPFTSGQEWMIKALHPADPLTEIRGVPDMSSMPTTMVNWQMSATVTPQLGATGTWAAEISIMPDPVQFAQIVVTDSVGAVSTAVLNSSVGSGDYTSKFNALVALAERWRLAYGGVTVYHDAPALSNQGTVVACVAPVEPSVFSCTGVNTAGGWPPASVYANRRAIQFQASDRPDYESDQRMPNAYFGQSKDGVYMPLKLSTNHQQWHSTADACLDASGWPASSGVSLQVPVESAPVAPLWPYAGADTYCANRLTTGPMSSTVGRRCYPCNENWGRISFRNLDVSSRLVLHFRFGYEMQCNPLSTVAPYMKLSPPYDRQAIEEYFAISRELKDAYPAEFNDWGKLWGVIKQAARMALPVIGGMGPIGAAVSGLGGLLLNGLEKKGQVPGATGQPKDSPPAAAVERAQALLNAPVVIPVTPRQRKVAVKRIARAGSVRAVKRR